MSELTTLSLDSPAVREAVDRVISLTKSKYPGHVTLESFALLALEFYRRQHGRLDASSAALLLKPSVSPLSSSLGLTTRL
jgi:hypothetical protein